MIIDLHCHYTFTGRRDAAAERFSFELHEEDSPQAFDSCVSPRALRRPAWRFLRHYFGLAEFALPGPEIDAALDDLYDRHLLADGPVERIVLLAFDAYHDHTGRRPPLPRRRHDRGSDIYTSNSLVRDACRRHPRRYLFGASVHPYRPDAVRCIDEVFAAGACLLKWIPLHQNIDVNDPRTRAVLRRCAELGLPVLAHFGQEFTLATQHPEYRSVRPVLEVLRSLRRDGAMPTTIIPHVATPVLPLVERDSFHALVAALRDEFADAPLYADISALTAWCKSRFLGSLATAQDLHPKLLFGTDFPVPPAMPMLRGHLRPDYATIAAETSWVQRAALVFRHVGFNEVVFHRAADLLPNVDYFARRAAPA